MGIALLALSGLFQGFSGLKRVAPANHPTPSGSAYLRPIWTQRKPTCTPLRSKTVSASRSFAPKTAIPALRVVRLAESGQRIKGAGRMVISGRMADVCAELDRLAALEAAQAGG